MSLNCFDVSFLYRCTYLRIKCLELEDKTTFVLSISEVTLNLFLFVLRRKKKIVCLSNFRRNTERKYECLMFSGCLLNALLGSFLHQVLIVYFDYKLICYPFITNNHLNILL